MTPSSSAATQAGFDFHGVPVQLSYPVFSGDPLRTLLSDFGPSGSIGAGVRIELTTSRTPTSLTQAEGWEPSFCHGLAQGYSLGGRHRLSDGSSLLEIDPSRGLLRGSLHAPPLRELASGMLHVAFCLLLREHGLFDAHAAVACVDDRALLVMGDAGSGKTTTLLALLLAGATYLGDDRVLLRSAPAGVELLGYPRDFHLTQETLRVHPQLHLDDDAPAAIDGKLRLDPRRAFPERFRAAFQGNITLLLPAIHAQSATTLVPLGAADALGGLLTSSATVALEVLPHRQAQLALLTRLANTASAFELRLGQDLLSTPEVGGARLVELIGHMHG